MKATSLNPSLNPASINPASLRNPAKKGIMQNDLVRRIWRARWLYVLMLPGLTFFVIYRYIPMWGILMAFQNYMPRLGIRGSEWVGLRHFQIFFAHDRFFQLLRNTLIISFGHLLIAFPMPIILSLMLNEVRSSKFKKGVQSVMYLPHFLSTVVVVSLMYVIFSMEDGIVNNAIAAMGLPRMNILMNARTYYQLFIGSIIWQSTGWGTIIFLAAIAGIDVEIYESARLEGANRFKQALYITLPSMLPIIMVSLVLSLGSILDVSVERTILLSNPLNREVAEVFDSYVFNRGIISGDFSYAAAVGLWKSLVGLILVLGANKLSKLVTDEAIY